MGIAVGETDLDSSEVLFRRASAALAEAKMHEPNSYRVFLPGEGVGTGELCNGEVWFQLEEFLQIRRRLLTPAEMAERGDERFVAV